MDEVNPCKCRETVRFNYNITRVREVSWPPLRSVGNMDHLRSTEQFAEALAEEVRALGFNLNYAPVADVDSNPANPVIGDRSFGRDPQMVARHVAAYVRATQARGLIACARRRRLSGSMKTWLNSSMLRRRCARPSSGLASPGVK